MTNTTFTGPRQLALLAAIAAAMSLAACGGGSGSSGSTPPPPSPPAISVALTPAAAQAVDQGQTLNFTAAVSNDSSNKGVSWSVSGGGALSNQTSSAVTYTAPASVSSPVSVTLTASSVASGSAEASDKITVNPDPAVTTTTLSAATVGTAYTVTLAASGGTGALSWVVSQGTLPAGLSLSAAGILSGTPSAAGTANFSVAATDAAKVNSPAVALSLAVAPAALAITTTSLTAATAGTAYSATLGASGGVTPYAWSLASGSSLPSGLNLSAAGVLSGIPTTAATSSFTVQVADAEATPAVKTQALSLTVNAAAAGSNDGEFNGQYAFSVYDPQAGAQAEMVGSVTADGKGAITGGEFDLAVSSAAQQTLALATGSSYQVGSDGRGTLTLADAKGNTYTFAMALGAVSSGVATRGGLVMTSGLQAMTGELVQQDPSAFNASALAGAFAFGLGGDSSGSPFAEAGSFTALAAGGLSNGLYDLNYAGNQATSQSFTGSLSAPDAHGRGSATIPSDGAPSVAYYVVSANTVLLLSGGGAPDVLLGEADRQTQGPYSAASLNGNAILVDQSATGVPSPHAAVGVISFDGISAVTAVTDTNDGGSILPNQSISGLSYAITAAANGRFTVSGAGINTIAGYLISPNNAILVSIAGTPEVDRGYAQAAGPFTAASLQGTFVYSTLAPTTAPPVTPPSGIAPYEVTSGEISFDGASALNATLDVVNLGTTGSTPVSVQDTYAVASNGRVTTGNGNDIFYIVAPTHLLGLLVTADNPNPVIYDLWQTAPPVTPPGGISVSLSPGAAQALDQGQTLNFTATVSNDASNKGVTWSLSGSGTLSNQTSSSVTYTAPASVSSATPATLTATSAAANTAVASVSVTVNPAPAVTTSTLAAATVGTPYSAQLAASGGTGALTWVVSQGSLPANLNLSPSGVISGTPTAAGTANFSVAATDAANVTAPAVALSLVVSASGSANPNDAEIKGQYALIVNDPNGQAPATLAASLTADGSGNISGGEYDLNGSTPAQQAVAVAGGSYSLGADGRGTLSFHDAANHTYTFAIAVGVLSGGVATRGGLIETDGNHLLAGELQLQDASSFSQAALSRAFAFGLRNVDSNFAEAGSFTASATGTVSNGLLDSNDNGTVAAAQAFTGTIGAVDGNGRGSMTITAGSTSSDLAFYVVSANRVLLFESSASSGPAIAGEADWQSGAPFSAAALGGNFVLVAQSSTGVSSPHALVGVFASDGVSAVSGVADEDDGGSVSLDQSFTGLTYAITSAANGRFALTSGSTQAQAGYIISPGNAFVVNIGGSPELSRLYAQSGGPFSAASVKGTFVLSTLAAAAPPAAPPQGVLPYSIVSGVITLDGGSALSGTLDDANSTGSALGGAYQTTYAVASNGRITTGDGTGIAYIISPTHVVILSMGSPNNPNPVILDLRQ